MEIRDILALNNTAALVHCDSKKSALELISKLAAANINTLDTNKVFESLIERERLGSTAVGFGVAIPHARIAGITEPIAALIQLEKPIAFDAPDDESVDILFGLILPLDDQDKNLNLLSNLAETLNAEHYRNALRAARNTEELYSSAIKVQR